MERYFCKSCGKPNVESDKGDKHTSWVRGQAEFTFVLEGRLVYLFRCGHCGAEQPSLATEPAATRVEGYCTDT